MTITLDLATCKLWLGLTGTGEDTLVTMCLDSTVAGVAGLPIVANDPAATSDPATWSDSVRLGAIMLTARRYRRRNSPGGIESYAESVLYVAKYDPEIASLLRLSDQKAPATDGPAIPPAPVYVAGGPVSVPIQLGG